MYAAVDIGTNSCRLLIADIVEGRLITRQSAIETTRIGTGVDKSGYLEPQAMQATLQCLEGYINIIKASAVTAWQAVATSAVREALNKADFVAEVKKQTGLEIDIIDGQEEARLSYHGVVKGLPLVANPLVVDLGGGSTEFIRLDAQAGEDLIISLPLGAVRAYEAKMGREQIGEILKPVAGYHPGGQQLQVVVVGGTATTLVAIKHKMIRYESERVHGQTLQRQEIAEISSALASMSLAQRRNLPGLQVHRADIIPYGALILLTIMEILPAEVVTVSESDLMQGIIWGLAGQSGG